MNFNPLSKLATLGGIFGLVITAHTFPLIEINPFDLLNIDLGRNVTFQVQATGSDPLGYQWRLNGVTLRGETNATLVITKVAATNGGSYHVVVLDETGATKSSPALLTLNIPTLALTDNFYNLLVFPDFSVNGVGRGNNGSATRETGEPRHGKKGEHSVWFKWSAPSNGVVVFRTAGSTFDTTLAAYTGNSVDALQPVDKDTYDDDQGGFHTSLITFNAVQGIVYHIAIDGAGNASGDIVLSWELDRDFSELPRLSQTPVDKTVFEDSFLALIVDYSASGSIDCEWFFNGIATGNRDKTLVFANIRPQNVGRYSMKMRNATGKILSTIPADIQISDDPMNVDPKNVQALDKFFEVRDLAEAYRTNSRQRVSMGGRIPVTTPATGYRGTQIFNTQGATKDPGEPIHCNVMGGASEWFSYYATNNGRLHINTDGSGFDTVLAIYTDPDFLGTFDALVEVSCDNNQGVDGRDSAVRFPAVNGTLYYIAVDGVSGAQGLAYINYNLGDPPTITASPENQVVQAGSPATLRVQALGSTNLTFFWFFNGAFLAQENTGILTLPNAQMVHGGNYQVVVSNYVDTATSAVATLTVQSPPYFLSEPQNQTASEGSNITISATGAGSSPLYFQWFFEGNAIVGATNQTLSILDVSFSQSGNYWLFLSNSFGMTNSASGFLTVNAPPEVLIPPQNQTVYVGSTVTFSVAATGTQPLRYQWRRGNGNGGDITGATNSSFVINNVQLSHAANYKVQVQNTFGSVWSTPAVLVVQPPSPPVISQNPQSQTASTGSVITLNVIASGTPPLFFQWLKDSNNLPGATAETLTIPNFNSSGEGSYSVRVSNSTGIVLSQNASLYLDAPFRILTFRHDPQTTTFRVVGVQGNTFRVESATTWTNWSTLITSNTLSGIIDFTEPNPTNSVIGRFYRASQQ